MHTLWTITVSYTHLRAHETGRNLVCRLLLEKKKKKNHNKERKKKKKNKKMLNAGNLCRTIFTRNITYSH